MSFRVILRALAWVGLGLRDPDSSPHPFDTMAINSLPTCSLY